MSECYTPVITPEAQNDIRQIVLYIAGELAAPQAALTLEAALRDGINSLSVMPERIRPVERQPWKDAGVRRMRIKNYYIYYVIDIDEKKVNVISVIYIGRDQEKQMSERKMEEW